MNHFAFSPLMAVIVGAFNSGLSTFLWIATLEIMPFFLLIVSLALFCFGVFSLTNQAFLSCEFL